jgi:predicted membrane channel-forming protein YqfA (hemolysin III family)
MSSSGNTKISTGNSTSTDSANSGTGGSTGSKVSSFAKGYGGIAVFTLLSISMFIGSFVSMSNFVGSKDDWNLIQPQITRILIFTLIGTFGLIVAALLYYVQDPNKSTYFILVVCCLALGLSFSSLAIAAISR